MDMGYMSISDWGYGACEAVGPPRMSHCCSRQLLLAPLPLDPNGSPVTDA